MKIAIDGPSGSGKSTVAKLVAKELSFSYLDTGAMYRTVAYMANNAGVNPSAQEKVLALIAGLQELPEVEDELLRTPAVNNIVSDVAKISEVRQKLVDFQRHIGSKKSIVMDGRDIGTVVLPDAELKIYLDATPEVRATRRAKESGEDFEAVLKSIKHRDDIDKNRAVSPLKQAEDAVYIDSSNMTIQEVVGRIVALARE